LQTAKDIHKNLSSKPGKLVPLIAETGGLNTMIVDSSALLERACDDIIRSAYNSAGQRCSALRVLLVHHDIYSELLTMIKGAMNDLSIGAPDELGTDIGPIISFEALKKLKNYIASMESEGNSCFQSKEDIPSDGSYLPPTLIELESRSLPSEEQFGPILHIASDIAQQTASGNVYINRDIVGAVVETQPFGGKNLSGSGFKAGGPNYLLQFIDEKVITVNTVAIGGNIDLINTNNEN
jgi:RHH-type proline utilization regulon transcriptional repressor/proline dehydrogenase/delta 1-pyrroline-5-carboxylate dehydrogenase